MPARLAHDTLAETVRPARAAGALGSLPHLLARARSHKTVEFHLSRVYRKLQVSSRAELIRRFAAEAVPSAVGG